MVNSFSHLRTNKSHDVYRCIRCQAQGSYVKIRGVGDGFLEDPCSTGHICLTRNIARETDTRKFCEDMQNVRKDENYVSMRTKQVWYKGLWKRNECDLSGGDQVLRKELLAEYYQRGFKKRKEQIARNLAKHKDKRANMGFVPRDSETLSDGSLFLQERIFFDPSMTSQSGRVLLITANVGSLFEQDQRLQEAWLKTFTERINQEMADIVVIHMQETGGKHYVECSWQVPKLINELASRMPMYPAVQTYLDLDHEAPNFTALGCVILINAGSIGSVSQFNFTTRSYSPVSKGLNILLNGLENSPHIVKRKFPQHFWPTFKWGRKGYMQTRWKVNNRTLDFVNVHLFHDESNLALIHENPFLYSSNRKRALDYVLEQLMASGNWESSPCFIFGDLNFRLDSTSFLNRLTERASAHPLEESHGSIADGLLCGGSTATCDTLRRTVSAIEFRRESQNDISSGCVLRIERKRFDYFNQKKLLNDWKSYLEDDREAANFKQLHELPINFPPTYPWSENPDESEVMMKTRAPAWCDRVLMNANAYEVVKRGNPSYSSFGRDVCTGDHKPVALAFSLIV